MLSAPISGGIGDTLKLSNERKTLVNYWFRHVWEFAWPIYPGVIIAAGVIGTQVMNLSIRQAPLVAAAIISGLVVGLRGVPSGSNDEVPAGNPRPETGTRRKALRQLLLGILPIVLAVMLILVLRLNIVLALLVVILVYAVLERMSIGEFLMMLRSAFKPSALAVVLGVMLFKSVFETSGLASATSQELVEYGVPSMVALFVTPFTVGFMTGVTAAPIAIAFPLLLPLLVESGTINYGAVQFAYTCGYAGVLVSPVHLCLALTSDYFGAKAGPLYRMIVEVLLPVAAVSCLMYFLL